MVRKCAGVFLIAGLMAAVAQASTLSDWNLITTGDVAGTSEVDGSALIGGNLTGTTNFAVHMVSASNGDGLAVGGDIVSGNIQVNNGGNLRLGGTNLGVANLNGGGATIADAGVSAMAAAAMAEIGAISTTLSGYAPNGTVDGAGNMNAVPQLIGGDMVAVYNITQADINGLGQLNLNIGSADSVIINFTGSANLVAPPNMVGDFNQANSSRILWNFVDATNISVNNNINGAMLAPFADLQVLGGGINGSVAVASVSALNAEIRQNLYLGHMPEPGSLALMAMGGFALLRRRS